MIGGRAAALVRLQLAGYFDLQAQDITAQNVDENPIATDLGDNPPSREAQIKLSNLDPESILCFLTIYHLNHLNKLPTPLAKLHLSFWLTLNQIVQTEEMTTILLLRLWAALILHSIS